MNEDYRKKDVRAERPLICFIQANRQFTVSDSPLTVLEVENAAELEPR